MEQLKLYIKLLEVQEMVLEDKTIKMILFDGFCEGPLFKGSILKGGVDTQILNQDGTGTLSARYMLKGYDFKNKPCNLYIENNAVLGEALTHPKIYTNSEALKWLETTPLTGKLLTQNQQLIISLGTYEA